MITILDQANRAFAEHVEQGIDAKIGAALASRDEAIAALQAQLAAVEPGVSAEQVNEQIAQALDGVRHLMFSEGEPPA